MTPTALGPRLVARLAALALVATACGSPSSSATQPPPAATAAPPAAAAQAAPTTQAAPPAQTTPASAVAATQSPAAAATQAQAGPVTLTLDPAASEARFIARELLANATIQNDAIGATKAVSGQIVVGPGGRIGPDSTIAVDLTTLTSDRSGRDNFIKQNTLQTQQYPKAEFVPSEAQGLPPALPTSGQATFKLVGDLTVHGVTRPATWNVDATFSPQDVSGRATTVVRLDDFGMQKPEVRMVASIEDEIRLEIDFRATRDA